MGTRIVPGRPRRVTRDLGDGECFVDVAGIEPASELGIDGVGTGQAISLLFELDRCDLARPIRHHAEIESELGLNVVSPLVRDDDHPGEITDLVLDESPKLRRVVDLLVDHTVERRLPHRVGAATGGDDRLVKSHYPLRGYIETPGFLETGRPEPVDVCMQRIWKEDLARNRRVVGALLG